MNKYEIEDEIRSYFEYISIAGDGVGVSFSITPTKCRLIREALKHESYITVNLEGVFDDD